MYGALLVIIVVSSIFETLSLAAFFPVFASVLGESEGSNGGILGAIDFLVDLMPTDRPMVGAAALLLIVFALKTVFSLMREALTAYASAKIMYQTKNQVLQKYAGAEYQFFLDSTQGTLLYNSQTAPQRLALHLMRGPQMLAMLLRIIAILVVLVFVAPVATAVVVVLGVVYLLVMNYLAKNVAYGLGLGRANASNEQITITNEFITGIRQVIAYCTGAGWLERIRKQNRIFCEYYAKDLVWLSTPRVILEFGAVAMMLGLIVVIRFFGAESLSDTLPRLGLFAVALVQLLPAFTALGRMRMEVMGFLPDADRVYETLTGPLPQRHTGTLVMESLEQGIEFEDVSFAYQDRATLLSKFNVSFDKGKVTAVVGPSGSGKTTLINLVLQLFEPTGGQIKIDGVPLRDIKVESWLTKIGLVSQETFLYHSTVADNIAFGRDGFDHEAIVEAAKVANADGFINEMPQGYDTVIGEMGMKLSGGQQQRVAIARAVLANPEVLIFDEATSSLDSVSERLVQEAIDKVSKDRTVILISHRLSTIRFADKILVMDGGRIVEQGSHEELVGQDGHYSRLLEASANV
jgi:ABC-type multidrug transport system fused ATPase/permease subunit